MQEQILIRKEDGPAIRPYNWYPTLGDCAEAEMEDVSKKTYGENLAFKSAGRLLVKHAP